MTGDTTSATSRTLDPRESYTGSTASMQPDPEARHISDAASVSYSPENERHDDGIFPILTARCATEPLDLEWVPDREQRVVPAPMRALCLRCQGRQACLLWALAAGEQGYWAGTTTKDRAVMASINADDVRTADQLQDRARAAAAAGDPLHDDGPGSYWWYRHGCRCPECRAANARRRAQERTRARQLAAA